MSDNGDKKDVLERIAMAIEYLGQLEYWKVANGNLGGGEVQPTSGNQPPPPPPKPN